MHTCATTLYAPFSENAAPPEAWERIGIVGDRGDKTIAQMLTGAVEHLAHHLKFIVEKRHAMGV